MSKLSIIKQLEEHQLKSEIEDFRVGDTIRIHTRIIEGNKERIQVFTGTVIARKGSGLSETFSVHRVAYGEGMERIFPLHSPRISKIEVVKEGKVRRGKLYYLRGTSGKASKVKGRVGPRRSSKRAQAMKPDTGPNNNKVEPPVQEPEIAAEPETASAESSNK